MLNQFSKRFRKSIKFLSCFFFLFAILLLMKPNRILLAPNIFEAIVRTLDCGYNNDVKNLLKPSEQVERKV